ncbi:hypothetical protein PV08_06956 [Exophiala spinifera]|uniref:Uncharacterized protein n=1 Tax=Exophiala spinifera TaxID=91928 RepID=A0A0D2B650_9EURO|nr:uncharacterized protein PV08_06956 [Exophiala spinifera]KIW14175.1 hypothetical protein PV08_06956 [Exophiala spinifera]
MAVKNFFVEQFPKLVARLRRTKSDNDESKETPKYTTICERLTGPNGHMATPAAEGLLGGFRRNRDGSRFSEVVQSQEQASPNSTRSHIVFAELPSRRSSMEGKRTPPRPPTPYPEDDGRTVDREPQWHLARAWTAQSK